MCKSRKIFYCKQTSEVNISDELRPFFRLKDAEKRVSTVPVELLHYSFQKKIIPSIHIFLAAKFLTNGRLPDNPQALNLLRKYCGINDRRTLKTHLQKLQEAGFIGYHEGIYYIRSYTHIRSRIKIKSITAGFLSLADFSSKSRFKAWSAAQLIKYRTAFLKKKRERGSPKDTRLPRAKQHLAPPFLTVDSLSKYLNVDRKEINRLKQELKKQNFLKFQRSFTKTKYTSSDLNILRKNHPEIGRKLIMKKGKVFQEEPSKIQLLQPIKFKTKRGFSTACKNAHQERYTTRRSDKRSLSIVKLISPKGISKPQINFV
jgi:hypothetical protein